MSFRGFLSRDRFDTLFDALHKIGAQCIGPSVKDGTISYINLSSSGQFPQNVNDQQSPGNYRLTDTNDSRWFAWANGAQALKPLVFAPQEILWHSGRDAAGGLAFVTHTPEPPLTAVFGVRACDLAALALQDQHFLHPPGQDAAYASRRRQLILIAVNCTHPAATCFCHSTGDGPEVSKGYDLLLDELDDGFAVRSATTMGEQIVQQLPLETLQPSQLNAITDANQQAAEQQTRHLPDSNIEQVLNSLPDSARWHDIAERCLSCGNCTAVCPSCFCHSQHDEPAADGANATHIRQWDSCFTRGHSYIHGLVIRSETRFRYRQWLTHKFASWIQQYGRSGCVGCGRCITWCPVGIDVTEELNGLAMEYEDA
jgi:ferredoxin